MALQWLRHDHRGQAAFFTSRCGRWQVRNLLGGWTLYDRGIPVGTYETPGSAKLAAAAVAAGTCRTPCPGRTFVALDSPPSIVQRQPCRKVPDGSYMVIDPSRPIGQRMVAEVATREEADVIAASIVPSARGGQQDRPDAKLRPSPASPGLVTQGRALPTDAAGEPAVELHTLAPGDRFRAPWSGMTGTLLDLSPMCASVQLDRERAIVINGEEKARARERTTWSLGTLVQRLAS